MELDDEEEVGEVAVDSKIHLPFATNNKWRMTLKLIE